MHNSNDGLALPALLSASANCRRNQEIKRPRLIWSCSSSKGESRPIRRQSPVSSILKVTGPYYPGPESVYQSTPGQVSVHRGSSRIGREYWDDVGADMGEMVNVVEDVRRGDLRVYG